MAQCDRDLKGATVMDDADRAAAMSELEERHRRIAELAYRYAQQRGFAPGYEEEDWLAAEREIEGRQKEAPHAEDHRSPK
jgi:transcription initiation factor TFIIIB Brf1 subunit/transcription initiation factor TFIIB